MLQRSPNDDAVRSYLARLLTERGQTAEAALQWTNIRDADARNLEAVFHLAKPLIEDGHSLDAAIARASPEGSPALRQNLREIFETRGADVQRAFRHVVICGTLWCGSTLFDHVLGSLPGVRNVGESHYLPTARANEKWELADFSSEAPRRFKPCTRCGKRCDVFDPAFRRELAADRTNWFARIAQRLGTQFLVSAEKGPAKLIECDPLLRFDAVVLFKRPGQAWQSMLRKLPAGREREFYLSQCDLYLDQWAHTYGIFLEHFRPEGRVAFVSFEEFTRRPWEVLAKLCARFSMPFDQAVLTTQRRSHAVSGNFGTIKQLRRSGYHAEIVPLQEPEFPAAQRRRLESHDAAQRISAGLLASFDTLMAG